MWTRELFGSDVYHLIAAFIISSVLGWFVESAYMSFCNHRLTNRGFAKGPFCPIYGFGAVIGYLVLNPLSGHYVTLYLTGAFLATTFEYLKEYGWVDENVSYEGTYTNEFAQVAADTLGMTDPEAK